MIREDGSKVSLKPTNVARAYANIENGSKDLADRGEPPGRGAIQFFQYEFVRKWCQNTTGDLLMKENVAVSEVITDEFTVESITNVSLDLQYVSGISQNVN